MVKISNYDELYACPHVTVRHSKVKVEENGKKYILNNSSGLPVDKYHLDGDIYKSGDSTRADYLLVVEIKQKAFIVELKGKNAIHAIEQLQSTERDLSNALPESDGWNVCLRLVYMSRGTKLYKKAIREQLRKISNLKVADGGVMDCDAI